MGAKTEPSNVRITGVAGTIMNPLKDICAPIL
jgi:hypothetical protein